jgi:tRNA G10  N-methylase Trm11
MEMRYIFGPTSHNNYHLTDSLIDIKRSVFLKGVISILYKHNSIKAIEQMMIEDALSFDNYKISYHKFDEVSYQTRLNAMRTLGTTIQGDFAISNPKTEFLLTMIKGEWIFGILKRNPNEWKHRIKKPFSYSHSLDIKIAKAAINIVIHNNFNLSLIDPCCGIGTVVIEGRFSSINTKGYEINPMVKHKCNLNLKHYNLIPDVSLTDMIQTTEHFDVAILDLPYGHYSNITTEEQLSLIRKTKEISCKTLIITMEDMSGLIESTGLKILDSCKIKKSNTFTRHITLCT